MELNGGVWPAIPGETPIDPSYLKDQSITTRRDLCRAEALNIRKAYVKYLAAPPTKRLAPFDYAWLLRLHQEMFGEVWLWAGQLRQADLNLGVAWHLISEQVLALTQDLSCWAKSDMSFLEQAARLHYRAVWIHPFMNGNGRWARLLANIWLGIHKTPLVFWPDENIGQSSPIRNEYIKALQEADEGEYKKLLALHKQFQSTK
ncbi:MAG: mobile mystery protein B [Pirellulales bacterium]|nr:mobile mystery protein B [Pirellulales bacterium]